MSDEYGVIGLGAASTANFAAMPLIKGYFHRNTDWSELQPAQNTWDWSQLDAGLAACDAAGKYASVFVPAGPSAPLWIYAYVPKMYVKTTSPPAVFPFYPWYLDPDFKTLFFAMHTALFNHLVNYKAAHPTLKLSFWQSGEGPTGDAGWVHGTIITVNPATGKLYDIPDQVWEDFKRETWIHQRDLIASNPIIKQLINAGNSAENYEWIKQNCPLSLMKNGDLGNSLGFNGEFATFNRLLPPATRAESEDPQNQTFFNRQCYTALVFGALAGNLDMLCVAPSNYDAMILSEFDTYVNSTDKGCCYMRDFIDYSDTIRFPESIYGPVIDPNRTRQYASHNNALYKTYEGEQLNWLLATSVLTYINPQRKTMINAEKQPLGFGIAPTDNFRDNDFGVKMQPGNYERNLHMVNTNFTRSGARLGSVNGKWGRWWRTFGIGQDEIFFDVESGLRLKDGVVIRIVYYDSIGSWALRYNAGDGTRKQATVVTSATNVWIEVAYTLPPIKRAGVAGHSLSLKKIGATSTPFGFVGIAKV